MPTFFSSLTSILPIVLMIAAGYYAARRGWIDEKTGTAFTKLLLNIALPCYMIWNLLSTYSRSKLLTLCGGLLIPLLCEASAFCVSILISNLAKIPKGRKGVFRSAFFCSNTIFVGLPINLALFGQSSVPYVLLYYIVNTTFFWTLGVFQISRDGQKGDKLFSVATLKRITSPALMGFIIAIILILLQITLPNFLMKTFSYLGDITTPLALIFIGLVLSTVKLRDYKLSREIIFVLFGRFVFSPLIVFLLVHILPVPTLMGKVFVIQAAMPIMTNTSIVAKGYGADYKFASVITVITTVLCIIAVPIWMVIIH